ncbi:MAG TPA: hypothetical protein VMV17_02505 [Streptosporangiaceae bacterium]|nr:hypothetical protein [Streptosporangiaceae bacterium]
MTGARARSAAAVTAHLEWMAQRGLAATTICYRRRLLGNLARHLPVPLLQATAADLGRWRGGLTVAPATVAHYVSHAVSFYGWACERNLVKVSPAAGIPVPSVRKGLPRPIGEEDLMAAIQTARGRVRPWIVLGVPPPRRQHGAERAVGRQPAGERAPALARDRGDLAPGQAPVRDDGLAGDQGPARAPAADGPREPGDDRQSWSPMRTPSRL